MSNRSPILPVVWALMSVLMPVGAQALETDRGHPGASEVPVAPPMGLIDLCEREPQVCAGPGSNPADLAPSVAHARQLAWRDVLTTGPRGGGPASVMSRTMMKEVPSDGTSRRFLGGLAVAGLQATPGDLQRVQAINSTINARVRPISDRRLYGRADVWSLPRARPGERPAGDCEDFVLAKREALLRAGVAVERLSIALARTPQGEDHAVLLVAFEDADYVLDNRDSRVLEWSRTDLIWQSRQRPGDLLKWVRL